MSKHLASYELPFPPSVNDYWHHNKSGKTYLSKRGKEFRQNVIAAVWAAHNQKPTPLAQELYLIIDLEPPADGRCRDLDNFDGKALFDALAHAGVMVNDKQVRRRMGEIHDPVGRGRVIVRVYEYERGGSDVPANHHDE